MTHLADARILYSIWREHFDPTTSADLARCAVAVQEAWLLVAAGARLLNAAPEPSSITISGLPYIATWSEGDSWKGACPRRPSITFPFPSGLYILDTAPNELPVLTASKKPPSSIRKIPGFIYDETPLKD